MSEQQMINGIRARDRDGMEAFLAAYGPLIRYIIAPILSDSRDREECLSDAALQEQDMNGPGFDTTSNFRSFGKEKE